MCEDLIINEDHKVLESVVDSTEENFKSKWIAQTASLHEIVIPGMIGIFILPLGTARTNRYELQSFIKGILCAVAHFCLSAFGDTMSSACAK